MTTHLFFGAQHDLLACIRTHLFIISPNNSGSTFLRRSFELSKRVWWLEREGQHVLGFAGPYTRGSRDALVWNATPDLRAPYMDPDAFDWEQSRKAWYFQARALSADAPVFVTSSPPFLMNVAALERSFEGAKFIFLTRDPYAVAEGILRRPIAGRVQGDDKYRAVTTHIGECFRRQRANIAKYADRALRFTYEDMTEHPEAVAARIRAYAPEVDDLDLSQPVPVKGMYYEAARNMNGDAFSRLSVETIDRLREGFAPYANDIEALGYVPLGRF